jgi:hypothetical protein
MASTYSPSLKITLMGDGDQSGIWGQTTNTNLGTLIEQAITGVVSIVMSDANYTLTNFDGVSNEARNAVLVVSGSNGAVRDLIPPVVKKLYIVANNTGGGFAIRVIGATGTGVSIPSGATQVVYCDGVNFFAASGAFVNGAVLGVPGGGTGKATVTSGALLVGNGSGVMNEISPATTGDYLRTDGSTWYSAPPPGAEFSSGTRISFNQTTAPTGWTKDTSVDNAALRLTSGSVSSGGSIDFTTLFASTGTVPAGIVSISSISGSASATTLTTPQIPSHTHTSAIVGAGIPQGGGPGGGPQANNGDTGATGGGGSHTHPFSFSSGAASFSGAALNLAVKYVDLIIAQKN